jgi:hypothetical protein
MSRDLSIHPFKLPHQVIVKAPGLLPMLYTTRELAEELSMPERTLRDWLIRGAPHTRDRLGRIWVNGQDFAVWVAAQRRRKNNSRLMEGEMYCLSCKQVVRPLHPELRRVVGKLVLLSGQCPRCGGKVHQGARGG